MDGFIKLDQEFRIFPILHGLAENIDDKKLTAEIAQKIIQTGAGGAVTNVKWDSKWLYDFENITCLRNVLKKLKQEGLGTWVYDEYWYPSGWANGYAIKNHPENAARNIAPVRVVGNGQGEQMVSLPEDGFYWIVANIYPVVDGNTDYERPIKAEIHENTVTFCGMKGEWEMLAFYLRPHNNSHGENTKKEDLPGGYREILNFLNKNAVDCFIDVALEPMARGISDFSELVDAIFTDEPSLMSMYYTNSEWKNSFNSVPWGNTLFADFAQRYGYSLEEVLPYLFYGNTEKAKVVRVQYYRLISDLMRDNFTKNVATWCRKQGIKYSGHLLLEEATYYHVGYYADFLKVISELDIPGFDILIADSSKFWMKGNAFGSSWCLAGKYASSAARMKSSNITMLEICPFMDTDAFEQNPFNEFMSLLTYCTFIGATHINAYRYEDLKQSIQGIALNDYVARIIGKLKYAASDCKIAMLYPITTAQAAFYSKDKNLRSLSDDCYRLNRIIEDLTLDIYAGKMDYNFVTEDALLLADVKNGELMIGDCAYRAIVLPGCEVLPFSVMEKLNELSACGIEIIFAGGVPRQDIQLMKTEYFNELAGRLCGEAYVYIDQNEALVNRLRDIISDTALTIRSDNVFVSKYKKENKLIYYIINPTLADVHFDAESSKDMSIYYPETGKTEKASCERKIFLPSGRGVFIEI